MHRPKIPKNKMTLNQQIYRIKDKLKLKKRKRRAESSNKMTLNLKFTAIFTTMHWLIEALDIQNLASQFCFLTVILTKKQQMECQLENFSNITMMHSIKKLTMSDGILLIIIFLKPSKTSKVQTLIWTSIVELSSCLIKFMNLLLALYFLSSQLFHGSQANSRTPKTFSLCTQQQDTLSSKFKRLRQKDFCKDHNIVAIKVINII